jgi:ATP-dependent helicase HrpB
MAAGGRQGRFRLSGGGRAQLAGPDPLGGEAFLVAAELDGRRPDAVIFLAASYDRSTLEKQFADRIRVEDNVRFDAKTRSVRCRRRRRLASLVLEEEQINDPPAESARSALIGGIRRLGIDALPWTEEIRNWRRRVSFLRSVFPEDGWPDLSDESLLDTLENWLGPHLDGVLRLKDLSAAGLKRALRACLEGGRHRRLEELAPVRLTVPSGFQRPLDYAGPVPVLAVKLQEMFGAAKTPAVAGGKVPVLLHLLSPAGRPVQVTRDLEGFWKNGYAAVKKEMKGRYPKHPWPEDPLAAEPTAATRRGSRKKR